MARGGQRGYGNAGRSAYSGGTHGGQARAVAIAKAVRDPILNNEVVTDPLLGSALVLDPETT